MENKYILLVLKTNDTVNTRAITEALARYTHEHQDNVYLVRTNISAQEFLVGIKSAVGEVEPVILRTDGNMLTQAVLPAKLQTFAAQSAAA